MYSYCEDFSLVEVIKDKLSRLKSRKQLFFSQQRGTVHRCKENFKNVITSINSLKCSLNHKRNDVNDHIIDAFEDWICKIKDKKMSCNSYVNLKSRANNDIRDEEDYLESFLENCKAHLVEGKIKFLSFGCELNEKKDNVTEDFEDFINRLKDYFAERKVRFKSIGCKINETKENVVDDFEDFLNGLKESLFKRREKMRSFKCDLQENFVDDFEKLISKVKDKGMSFSSFIGIESRDDNFIENVEYHFESLLESCREYFIEKKEKISSFQCEINEKKENIIDDFEDLVKKLKYISLDTGYQTKKLDGLREDVTNGFECLLQQCNDYAQCIEENVKCFAKEKRAAVVDDFDDIIDEVKHNISNVQWAWEEKKNVIVDEFEDLCENTKWMLEDRNNALFGDINLAFDDAIENVNQMIEEGKQEIKEEICVLENLLSISERFLKYFLCYCEKIMSEFFAFSEKRVVCFVCEGKKKAKVFYNEVVDSLVRGYDDKLLCDNLVLEINSSRYAYNVTMSEVNFHVVRALLTLPGPDGRSWQQLASRLSYFVPILTNYIRSDAAQRDCILAIEDVAITHPEIFDVMVKIIHWLYDKDILSEEILLEWYQCPSPDIDVVNAKRVRAQVTPFIKWLKEAEEQSTGDDEDDDDYD